MLLLLLMMMMIVCVIPSPADSSNMNSALIRWVYRVLNPAKAFCSDFFSSAFVTAMRNKRIIIICYKLLLLRRITKSAVQKKIRKY